MQNFPDKTENPRGFGGTPDPEPETNEDGMVNATDEEQMQYDLLSIRARKMIFGPAKEKVLEMLGSSESPGQGMGKAGAMIIKSLVDAAASKGMEINADVGAEAGADAIEDLNELGKSAGVFQYDDKESEAKEVEDAMLWGVKYYGEAMQGAGQITPEMQKAAQQMTIEGLAEEQGPQKKSDPIAEGVSQALPPPGGLVGGNMQQPTGRM
jgi:hypothetical protein